MLNIKPRRHASGFSMIEVLVALTIMAFGMIALAKLQFTLFASADVAKQRTEAVRLAQEQMENLRSYQQLASAPGVSAYADIVSGSAPIAANTYTSNASFVRSWTVVSSAAPPLLNLNVAVSWTDRTNTAQSVALNSMIAQADPKASGSLLIPPEGSPVKKPNNRDLNIPVPAKPVGTNQSAFTPPGGSGFYYVFSNATGLMIKRCIGDIEDHDLTSVVNGVTTSVNSCTDTYGYLISGFIKFDTDNSPNPLSPSENRFSVDLKLTLTTAASYECTDDSQTTATYPNTVTYMCAVYPTTNADTSTATWSGYTWLAANGSTATSTADTAALTVTTTGNNGNSTNTTYKVCRYSYDYSKNGQIDNSEHPFPYSNVGDSLENQNFLIIANNQNCPVGGSNQIPVEYRTCLNNSSSCS